MADNPILDLLNSPNLSPEALSSIKDILSTQNRLQSVGIDPLDATPRESLFMKGLNFLDKGGQAVRGILDSALVRGDIFQPGVGLGVERAWNERTSGADILRRSGMESPIARGLLGFGTDVLTDPLSWLSLGSTSLAKQGLAKAGGRFLSKEGMGVKDAIEKALLAPMLGEKDAALASGTIDKAFAAMGMYKDELTKLRRTGKAFGKASKELGLEKELVASRLAELEPQFKPLLEQASQVMGKPITDANIADLFAKPQLSVSMTIPGLGHLIGAQDKQLIAEARKMEGPIADLFIKEAGPVKKGLKAVGKVASAIFKPGTVGTSININDGVLDAIVNANALAKEKIGELVTSVPIIGKPLVDTVSTLGKGFQKIFARKFFEGEANHYLETQRQNVTSTARQNAERTALNIFDKFIHARDETGKIIGVNKDGQETLKQAALLYDSAMTKPIEMLREKKVLTNEEGTLLKLINNAYQGVHEPFDSKVLSEGVWQNLDQLSKQNVQILLQSPEISPEVKEAISILDNSFKQISEVEKQLGIKYNDIEAYLPHRYSAFTHTDFTKKRKFATLKEALGASMIGDTNAVALYAKRLEDSIKLQGTQAYFQRMVIQNGLPFEKVKQLYIDAAKNPTGPEAAILKRRGFANAVPWTQDEIGRAKDIFDVQTKGQQIIAKGLAEKVKPTSSGSEVGTDVAQQVGLSMGRKGDKVVPITPEVQAQISAAYQDFNDSLSRALIKQDFIPKDFNMPDINTGELGKSVFTQDGKQFVMPVPIAEAMKENMATRDILRKALAGSDFGSKVLRMFDSSMGFLKRTVTLPFPSYWANNMLGDTFFRAMDGGLNALDPGLLVRTHDFLSGKTALKTKSGGYWTPESFIKLARQNGLAMSQNDMLEVVDAAGALNLDKAIAQERSGLKNLVTGHVGTAMEQASQKLRDKFETFFRMSHTIHRLEQGDTFMSALNHANDAMINYRDLSPVEQSLFRRFYMFYGWLSKSTKKSLTSLFTQPADLTNQLRAARGVSEFFSSPDAAPTAEQFEQKLLQTVTSQEQVAFPLGRDKEGKTLLARGYGLPVNTLLQSFSLQQPRSFKVSEVLDAAGDSIVRTVQKQFAAANPLINTAAQQISGKNLYFDKPLNSAFLQKLPMLSAMAEKIGIFPYNQIPENIDKEIGKFLNAVPDGKGHLIADAGKFWVLVNLVPALSRVISTANYMANADISATKGMLPVLTGTKIEQQDPERSYLGTYKEELDKLAKSQSYGLRKKTGFTGWDS